MEKKKEIYFIPKWLYYASIIICVFGTSKIISGKVNWGETIEESVLIILVLISFIILLTNSIVIYLKKKKLS